MIRGAGLDGLLPLDKPVGPTSHDMVAVARRELGLRRIGHTGTLDPFASGLLLLCVGRSTRLAEYLSGLPKEYVARARLGEATETDDVEGEVTARSDAWTALGPEDITDALAGLLGDIEQLPPTYSAKKIRGRTAYRRAREGEDVTLSPASVTVHDIQMEELALPEVRFRVRCSTGTYVRALARDLGERLGVGAHLRELRREGIGPFHVTDALGPTDLGNPDAVERAGISPLAALAHLPRVQVEEADAHRIQAGRAISVGGGAAVDAGAEVAVAWGNRLLAVGLNDGEAIRPKKVFPVE